MDIIKEGIEPTTLSELEQIQKKIESTEDISELLLKILALKKSDKGFVDYYESVKKFYFYGKDINTTTPSPLTDLIKKTIKNMNYAIENEYTPPIKHFVFK